LKINKSDLRIKDIGIWELAVIQAIVYSALWLSNEYIASLVSIILVPIVTSILIISILSELIEKSKVPRVYFKFMVISIIIPIFIALLMKLLFGTIIWD
jgi:hypothetical protein